LGLGCWLLVIRVWGFVRVWRFGCAVPLPETLDRAS
jgi:hypothetical protein